MFRLSTHLQTPSVNTMIDVTFRLYGVWPGTANIFGPLVIWPSVICIFIQVWCAYYAKLGLPLLVEDLNESSINFLVFSKFTLVYVQRRYLHAVAKDIAEDWEKASKDERELMVAKAKTASFCVYIYSFLAYATALLYIFRVIYTYIVKEEEERVFVARLIKPFAITKSPYFEIISCYQGMLCFNTAVGESVVDGYLMSTILHIGGQIELMNNQIMLLPTLPKEEIMESFDRIITKHQRIINFCNNVEDLFCGLSLIHFFISVTSMCSLGFLLATCTDEMDRFVLIKTIVFFFACSCSPLTVCAIGQYLINKSLTITETLYKCEWHNLTVSQARIVHFMLLRSQSLMRVTGGKLFTASFEQYATMLKASLSYASVLRQFY